MPVEGPEDDLILQYEELDHEGSFRILTTAVDHGVLGIHGTIPEGCCSVVLGEVSSNFRVSLIQ